MTYAGWGGGVEVVAFSCAFDREVHVYEPCTGLLPPIRLRRVSSFLRPHLDLDVEPLHLSYIGRAHYEVLAGVTSGQP